MEGIFVCDKLQSQGIGKLLLDFVKKSRICLHCLMDAALGGKHKRLNIGI